MPVEINGNFDNINTDLIFMLYAREIAPCSKNINTAPNEII
jgi:hypothetical protein